MSNISNKSKKKQTSKKKRTERKQSTKGAKTRNKKVNIPKAVKTQVWLKYNGDKYMKQKCYVNWCKNLITPFNFHVGHNIPESSGGTIDINNLRPICAQCNLSMGDRFTIDSWEKMSDPKKKYKYLIMVGKLILVSVSAYMYIYWN